MSSRRRQDKLGAAATMASCACCDSAADPDSNKYHRRHRLPLVKKLMVERKLLTIMQVVMIVGGAISLALSFPVFVSKSLSMLGIMTNQQRRNLRPPPIAVDPPSSQYHQINMKYPGITSRTNTTLPPHVYTIDNFLTEEECNFLIENAQDCLQPSTVTGGKNGREQSTSRSSWTCRLHREDLPILMSKVMKLTIKPSEHIEHPQLARYESTQQFLPHYDAYDQNSIGVKDTLEDGGNRLVTILIYLNDVEKGGGTRLNSLNLEVRPRSGMAVVFFPSTADGKLDQLAMHAALPAVDVKYVSQIWVRQGDYVGDRLSGKPEKRLSVSELTDQTATSFWNWF